MSNYTKGPWRIDGVGLSAIVRGDDVTIVAVRHRLSRDVNEANMKLIACAPDMAEMLAKFQCDFKSFAEDGIRPDEWLLQEWGRNAEQLLKKAGLTQ